MLTLSVLVVALFAFVPLVSSVTIPSFTTGTSEPLPMFSARSQWQRHSPTLVAVLEGLTNARRFAAGLPPIPLARRWIGSKVDTARRSTLPLISRVGEIEVYDAEGKRLGWLSDDFSQGHYKLANTRVYANIFTANLGLFGTTSPVNFKDAETDNYLAGLINPGSTLDANSGFAILAHSGQVPLGPPQVNNPSTPGMASETAIWSYGATTGAVTGTWINQSPSPSVQLHIWYDNPEHTFYLTGTSDPPTGKSDPVTFRYVLV